VGAYACCAAEQWDEGQADLGFGQVVKNLRLVLSCNSNVFTKYIDPNNWTLIKDLEDCSFTIQASEFLTLPRNSCIRILYVGNPVGPKPRTELDTRCPFVSKNRPLQLRFHVNIPLKQVKMLL
jgi:hypothetical protein